MTDMQGRLMGKRMHAPFFLSNIAAHGAEGCNYLLAVDVEMNTVQGYEMSSWDTGYGDFVFKPDMSSLRPIPWLERTALVVADLEWHDGAPALASPRQILRRQIAWQHGHALSFIAKYNEREGNSCHIHCSFWDGNGSLFPGDRNGFSKTFEHFVAGQLAATRELAYMYAPNINSYKRFAWGSFAPTAMVWGRDNRTCAFRVVGHGNGLR